MGTTAAIAMPLRWRPGVTIIRAEGPSIFVLPLLLSPISNYQSYIVDSFDLSNTTGIYFQGLLAGVE